MEQFSAVEQFSSSPVLLPAGCALCPPILILVMPRIVGSPPLCRCIIVRTFVPQERLGRILRPSEHCLWLPQRGWGRAAGEKRETEALPFRDQLGWMRGKKTWLDVGGGLLAGAELLHLLHFGIHCFCHCISYTDPIIARRVITCKEMLFIIKN